MLVTFGALNRTSELTAMKATGISLYRIITPVLVVTVLISVGLFAFDETYLPAANRRQEALLSIIKDKPAQTFFRPDRKWISGQTNSAGEPARIFYYQFFDAETNNVFANLTVFEFDPATFTLQRRIFATSAALGSARQQLGLRQRLAAHLLRRNHRQLPALHRLHLPRDPRAAHLLQEGSTSPRRR